MTLVESRATRGAVVAVASGKGGVGKTNVVINLAVALARRGHRVGILDADFGLGNIDVMLGLTPPYHLGHLLSGERTLDEIVVEGPLGIRIIPASSGIRDLTALTPRQWQQVRDVVRRVRAGLDFLLIDTAAGISTNVIELLLMADRTLVVTSFDPAAIVDAYAMIKVLTSAGAQTEIGVVVSSARDLDEASLVYRQLELATTRFLKRSLSHFGSIEHDPAVREAVLAQRPVVDHAPQARASRSFRILASRLAATPGPDLGRETATPDVTSDTGNEESLCA